MPKPKDATRDPCAPCPGDSVVIAAWCARMGTDAAKAIYKERAHSGQCAIVTCRLHGVDVYTYLVDVLQRMSIHPARDVLELTPRLWKTKFAHHPMRSDIALADP